jgi:cell division protein FtsB
MKMIALVLLILLVWLQYKIWLQDGGIPEVLQLEDEVVDLQDDVTALKERNASLDAEVKDLKKGLDAIEERARNEMGMIREGETYYQVVDRRDDNQAQDQPQIQILDKDDQPEKQAAEKTSTQASGSNESRGGDEVETQIDTQVDTQVDTQIDIKDNLIKR